MLSKVLRENFDLEICRSLYLTEVLNQKIVIRIGQMWEKRERLSSIMIVSSSIQNIKVDELTKIYRAQKIIPADAEVINI